MSFVIQSGCPAVVTLSRRKRTVANLSGAIQRIFPSSTERAYIIWNGIPVSLDYRYDLCVMIDDILFLLKRLLAEEEGTQHVCFASQGTFEADWQVRWTQKTIEVKSDWKNVQGQIQNLLNQQKNQNNAISMEKTAFLCEWKMLLLVVVSALENSSIVVKNEDEVSQLRETAAALPQKGVLYEAVQHVPPSPEYIADVLQNVAANQWQSDSLVSEMELQTLMEKQGIVLPQNYQYLLRHHGAGTLTGSKATVHLKPVTALNKDTTHEEMRRCVPGAFVFADDAGEDNPGLFFYDTLDWVGYGQWSVLLWPWSDGELSDLIYVAADVSNALIQAAQGVSLVDLPSLDNDMY